MLRRHFLTAGLAALARPTNAEPVGLRLELLGQALIEHDLPAAIWPDRGRFTERFGAADACLTNLETVIRGPRAGAPTREALTLHAAGPEILATLQDVNINLVGTANNHAFDLGAGGILDTVASLRTVGLPSAGSGADLAEAAAPAYRATARGVVALVAFATGKVREGGAATPTRPGVNEVRRGDDGQPLAEDVARVASALRAASLRADVVVACHHNHDWEPDMAEVPDWQRALAKQCVEAGASVFVGHGAPVLQGIEFHQGAPLFYGLGNFIFQTEKPPGAYPPAAWESVVVGCVFVADRCRSARLTPIVLNEVGLGGDGDQLSRGVPAFADRAQAQKILEDLDRRSRRFGTRIGITVLGQGQLGIPLD